MEEKGRPWSFPQMVWSALLGAALMVAIGFSWFGPGLNWMTEHGAETMALNMVSAKLVPICLARARADSAFEERLARLKETSTWSRDEKVNEFGWALMPGEESPTPGVAKECANRLTS